MPQNSNRPTSDNPADIAREAFHLLAKRRVVPTPDEYRRAYDEVAGIARCSDAETVLTEFAANLAASEDALAQNGLRLVEAIACRDWDGCGKQLDALLASHRTRTPTAVDDSVLASPAAGAAPEMPDGDGKPPGLAKDNGLTEIPADMAGSPLGPASAERQAGVLRDLLARTLSLALTSVLEDASALAAEADMLGRKIKNPDSEADLEDIAGRIRQLCFRIEMESSAIAEQKELLRRLFHVILDNLGELLDDDPWMRTQIASVQALLVSPLSGPELDEAARNLKELVYRQGLAREGVTEAKESVKKMAIAFTDQVGMIANAATEFHRRINAYAQQLREVSGIEAMNGLLKRILRDTPAPRQPESLPGRDDGSALPDAPGGIECTEDQTNGIRTQGVDLDNLVYRDQLTGSLNRRGVDETLAQEITRTEQDGQPLCVVLLQSDDFQTLNNTMGYLAGDGALAHLVQVASCSLRRTDIIGRFNNESFLIILPASGIDDAHEMMARLRHMLSECAFAHGDGQCILAVTAGVVPYISGDDARSLIKRAKKALCDARNASHSPGDAGQGA